MKVVLILCKESATSSVAAYKLAKACRKLGIDSEFGSLDSFVKGRINVNDTEKSITFIFAQEKILNNDIIEAIKEKIDLLLLSPQIKNKLKEFKENLKNTKIKVGSLNINVLSRTSDQDLIAEILNYIEL
ncbi:hypothetical protein CPJCM30710_07890 [Clostridium polyendosporum]|uniref:PTS EIIB type-3 domain-containing protein n=1 Tax=Clostridium polyendosporum TaxID=69208 RepID=A0A919RYX0_9CLOT|nr:hypothetical protein [Clostridium polyendosporum]GIM28123.1 hypothetical protein CPJCM30710_07890 [Clostridium polyendosporum]